MLSRKPAHRNTLCRMSAWLVIIALTGMTVGTGHAIDAESHSQAALKAKYTLLLDKLSNSPFQQPLHLDSRESADSVTGEIYALLPSSFATIGAALRRAQNWCDIVMLHQNTKHCEAATTEQREALVVFIGKKYDQPLEHAHRVVFTYAVAEHAPDYLRVQLNADEGPLSTRDYRLTFEAVPSTTTQTFVRLSYAYAYGMVGKLAMQAYLGTAANEKVGFTVTGKRGDGTPLHIGGMRGLVERNAMRYFLAIEAFLGALALPPQARLEKSLRDWFAATERYPRQLREMNQTQYLQMKRKEYQRRYAPRPRQTLVVPGVRANLHRYCA